MTTTKGDRTNREDFTTRWCFHINHIGTLCLRFTFTRQIRKMSELFFRHEHETVAEGLRKDCDVQPVNKGRIDSDQAQPGCAVAAKAKITNHIIIDSAKNPVKGRVKTDTFIPFSNKYTLRSKPNSNKLLRRSRISPP